MAQCGNTVASQAIIDAGTRCDQAMRTIGSLLEQIRNLEEEIALILGQYYPAQSWSRYLNNLTATSIATNRFIQPHVAENILLKVKVIELRRQLSEYGINEVEGAINEQGSYDKGNRSFAEEDDGKVGRGRKMIEPH